MILWYSIHSMMCSSYSAIVTHIPIREEEGEEEEEEEEGEEERENEC